MYIQRTLVFVYLDFIAHKTQHVHDMHMIYIQLFKYVCVYVFLCCGVIFFQRVAYLLAAANVLLLLCPCQFPFYLNARTHPHKLVSSFPPPQQKYYKKTANLCFRAEKNI
eukprot:GEMP01039854.1.p1 GENE.GEMP01039854.1~~GEMP01039854.1.p1  ORF type:complete len:110 (-),score=1.24 GEMP01039854.1:1236-1565(-)